MRRTLGSTLLTLLLAASSFAAAGQAQAAVHHFKLRAGPYDMGAFNVRFPKQFVRAPKLTGDLTDMSAHLVDARGRRVRITDVMLHHLVFKNASRFQGRRTPCRARNGEAFFGTGEEQQVLDLPQGYGYPVKKADRWRMNVMLMSHNFRSRRVYVEYEGTIVTGKPLKRVVPYWVSAQGCGSNPSYPVYASGPTAVNTRVRAWRVPISGNIVAAGGHLHGGARNLFVTQPSCRNRRLFDHKPLYGMPSHPYYTVRPVLHEPGPINTRWFSSRTGIGVNQGEKLRVVGLYDASVGHTRVMAITHLYIHPTGKRTHGCKPLPKDIHDTWRFKAGRPAGTEPLVQPKLYTLSDTLRPVEIDKPAGPLRDLDSGSDVEIRNFHYYPANVHVPVGGTLTYRFEDTEPHNLTWASGPWVVGIGNSPKGTVSTKTFPRPGTYKLFCYLHPMQMNQVVTVG